MEQGLVWEVRGDRGVVLWGIRHLAHQTSCTTEILWLQGPSLPRVNPRDHIGHGCFVKGQEAGVLLSPFWNSRRWEHLVADSGLKEPSGSR